MERAYLRPAGYCGGDVAGEPVLALGAKPCESMGVAAVD